MKIITPILLDQAVEDRDKLRVILLYILAKNGINTDNLEKLVQHGQVSPAEKGTIHNLANLGVNVITDVSILCSVCFVFFYFNKLSSSHSFIYLIKGRTKEKTISSSTKGKNN